VRSEHLDASEIEFMRWRAERWMKLRHFWPVLRHSPWFVLRHGHEMLRHTFRGFSWRSLVGLETEREVFARYKSIRGMERRYL
jgi:anaerobic magnesium-protoporphyrin IX monomethyl ester cyclase